MLLLTEVTGHVLLVVFLLWVAPRLAALACSRAAAAALTPALRVVFDKLAVACAMLLVTCFYA